MPTLHLTYDPAVQATATGWYLPTTELDTWLRALAKEAASTKVYLAPHSIADPAAIGLIALRLEKAQEQLPIPAGAIPLICSKDKRNGVELWLPMFASLSLKMPLENIFAQQTLEGSKRLVWLPPDASTQERLVGLSDSDEVDLSVLVKPSPVGTPANQRQWAAPPQVATLPERIVGLNVTQEMITADPFFEERETIGGDSDDLMELDEQGRVGGGGLGSQVGRMFRKALEKLVAALKARQRPSQEQTAKSPPGNSSAAQGQADKQAASKAASNAGGMSAALYQKLQSMLAEQREKQLKKLLALMARDPDRALKYAIPMAGQGASRGLAQPGSKLGQQNVDFSISKLFGGGQAVDPWQFDAQLQAQLLASYRAQADREMAAGRYRRAAYIYAHLLGELSAAGAALEKGKFYMEAAALYKQLERPLDQARCLRMSGQLSEAAQIYEQLENYEAAAEMWMGVGDHAAARGAFERACESALRRHEILKAVSILEMHLDEAERAEKLLWEQWPHGHQVIECTKLGFERLAQQGRAADAHRHFDAIVANTDRRSHTLLAQLCVSLFKSFPDPALRVRVEDQCRISAVDNLAILPRTAIQERMQILSSLHNDDVLLQRDTRRFERQRSSTELTLRPAPSDSVARGKLKALTSVNLGEGYYFLATMIKNELFTLSMEGSDRKYSRFAELTSPSLAVNSVCAREDTWNKRRLAVAHCHRYSDPLYVHVGYATSGPESVLLTPATGGDDFWIIRTESSNDASGNLCGIGDDGYQWWWDGSQLTARHSELLPKVIDCREIMRSLMEKHMEDFDTERTYVDDIQRLGVVLGNLPCVAWHRTVVACHNGKPEELATLPTCIQWMIPSLPMTEPRLLVITESELWIVPISSDTRPEKLITDERFIDASFLPGGRIAAATARELLLFQRTQRGTRIIDRQPLQTSSVVAVLSLTAETIGVLFGHGMMQRWRIM